MEIYEITGFQTGKDHAGVNFLDPKDAFEEVLNGYVHRQELKSRLGFSQFSNRLGDPTTAIPAPNADGTRVMGIFENIQSDGTSELLICSLKYLYRYNVVNNELDQIPMAGSVAGTDFNISDNDQYVSGTTYLTKLGAQRFIFTSVGMSNVYSYDGTDVRSFTNAIDNPDFQQPAASIGNLISATHVIWFGERLNLFNPHTTVTTYLQGVLYSGIRDSSGNGDKFNVPGSGLAQADTYEELMGAKILGDVIIMSFRRSSWVMEKTRDAFNPYLFRKIPSVLGTDAAFSPVIWNYEHKSVGKTGFISTEGRQSVKFDTKVPYFTSDDIDADLFSLTYGGFDRTTNQFLFSYRSGSSNMATKTQDAVIAYNYEESSWSDYDMRFSVFGQAIVGRTLAWDDIYEVNNPAWIQWDNTEEIWDKIGIEAGVQKTLAGDNRGYVYQLNQDYDDHLMAITNITTAANAIITTGPYQFEVGDTVFIENVVGMLNASGVSGVNGKTGTILSIDATGTLLTTNIKTSDFTAYISDGTISIPIEFEVLTSLFNPFRSEGRKVFVSHIEFLIEKDSGILSVDILQDESQTPIKPAVLLIPNPSLTKKQWITASVNQELNFMSVKISQESATNQTIIYSIRVHCDRGSMAEA